MHETVIASSLLKIVLEEANKQKKPVLIDQVHLKIGLLSCIEPQTVQGCFEILAENTAAANAELIIERLPLQGFCKDCKKQITTQKRHFACPHCQSSSTEWQGGSEMLIASIKVHETE